MFNLPNLLTFLRIVLSFTVFLLLEKGYYLSAVVLFLLAVLTDFLDGFFARRLEQKTALGQLMDPIADKLLFWVVMGYVIGHCGKSLTFKILVFSVFIKDLLLVLGSIFLLKKGKLPRPNLLGKITVTYLFGVELVCLLSFTRLIEIVPFEGFYLIGILLVAASTLSYLGKFLREEKTKKEEESF